MSLPMSLLTLPRSKIKGPLRAVTAPAVNIPGRSVDMPGPFSDCTDLPEPCPVIHTYRCDGLPGENNDEAGRIHWMAERVVIYHTRQD